ncbi:3-hydroxybutyrate dehydrogenase [Balneatrix alpica]|uniref:3-hydroxybutyrate dehydrogenase n=1 Tax=Balneatrix alpica TaxID=75684 RepID=UPI00273A10DB|nr:3-hydroxybutyrate dehydrogenase [Balneatrix alpica]
MNASTPAKPWVLITGAGSGIGEGIAVRLAQQGYPILVTDLRLEAANQVASAIQEQGGQARAAALDVSSTDSIQALVAELQEPVGVLINNAGLQHVSRLEDFPPEKWALLIQIMLTGVAMLTQALLPGMRERGFGRIINVGSIHSLVASPYKSAYVAAKHGLLGFSKVVALETADTDITINTLCPSYVKTPLVEQQIAAQAKENGITPEQVVSEIMLKPMPKGVFISLDELAGIAAFLISDCARNITGQTITVDGGWTVR